MENSLNHLTKCVLWGLLLSSVTFKDGKAIQAPAYTSALQGSQGGYSTCLEPLTGLGGQGRHVTYSRMEVFYLTTKDLQNRSGCLVSQTVSSCCNEEETDILLAVLENCLSKQVKKTWRYNLQKRLILPPHPSLPLNIMTGGSIFRMPKLTIMYPVRKKKTTAISPSTQDTHRIHLYSAIYCELVCAVYATIYSTGIMSHSSKN